MYKVFTDFHHASLLNSLIMLFEGRLGGEVYRPIGTEWYKRHFWYIHNHPATVEQFLGINGATPDGSRPVNDVKQTYGTGIGRNLPGDGLIGRAYDATVYLCHDLETGNTNKAITFDGFMHLDIDIVIASIPKHIEPFRKLCEIHPSKPKLIFQVGNQWTVEAGSAPNVMASAKVNIPAGVHGITYHQEFDLDIFSPTFHHNRPKTIRSFVNCFNIADIFKLDWMLFEEVEKRMSRWDFKSFGGQCRDGAAHGNIDLVNFIRNTTFIWHTKMGGDGYGHIVHNAAACGTPLIVRKSQYLGKLAEPLMIDGETCIDIDGLSTNKIIDKINHYSQPDEWQKLSRGIYRAFQKNVDFDAEFELIKQFLASLR